MYLQFFISLSTGHKMIFGLVLLILVYWIGWKENIWLIIFYFVIIFWKPNINSSIMHNWYY